LVNEDDIKVRVNPFKKYSVGNKPEDFIYVFAYVMEGRNTQQKADLSKIAMNVYDFEKATDCNKDML